MHCVKPIALWRVLCCGWLAAVLGGWCQAAVPAAPSGCAAAGIATTGGYATIWIQWIDQSVNETQWILQLSSDNGASYQSFGAITSATQASTGNVIAVSFPTALANTRYLFRAFAYNASGASASSNVSTVTPKTFTLTASAVPCVEAIDLTWSAMDNAMAFAIYYRPGTQTGYSYLGYVSGSATSVRISAPTVERRKGYYFYVVPYLYNSLFESTPSGATVDLPAVMTSSPGIVGVPGAALSHVFIHQSEASVQSRALTGDLTGLAFNPSTGVLTGVYPALGANRTLNYAVTFTSGSVLRQTFQIRPQAAAGAPAVAVVIPGWAASPGAVRETSLTGTFTDAEAESAVRVTTNVGVMDFILFNSLTPATVANFMQYVNAGRYTNVSFHRSISNFMVQSGGFTGTGTSNQFTRVATNAPVVNEPGVPNVRGTISMAKADGDPNSATSQFFISVADNRANLDFQNGGFSVFGRVAGNGMAVADAISVLPTATYSLLVDGATTASFPDFPLNAATAPVAMDQTKLVKVLSVAPVATMSYAVTGNSQPGVASAAIIDGKLRLTALAPGQTLVTVTATDLDNLTTNQQLAVQINDTLATWSARQVFPGGQSGTSQDPDRDGWNNLQEYAFLGNPAQPNAAVPSQGLTNDARLTVTFPVRKFTDGLSYAVEAADSLTGAWSTIWSSGQGFAHAQVVAAIDLSDQTRVTIKDSVRADSRARRFMRVKVVQN